MKCYKSDLSKFIAGALYITKKLSKMGAQTDFYRVFKIMYFSDLISLPQYYQTVFGDWHAIKFGPIPEDFYKLIKEIKYGKKSQFSIDGNNIVSHSDPDMDEFTDIDIECIDKSIEENAFKSFKELKDKSHGSAWDKTLPGYRMNILDIARDGGANEHAIEFIKERAENCSPTAILDSVECLA
jgi:hypothetical protein